MKCPLTAHGRFSKTADSLGDWKVQAGSTQQTILGHIAIPSLVMIEYDLVPKKGSSLSAPPAVLALDFSGEKSAA